MPPWLIRGRLKSRHPDLIAELVSARTILQKGALPRAPFFMDHRMTKAGVTLTERPRSCSRSCWRLIYPRSDCPGERSTSRQGRCADRPGSLRSVRAEVKGGRAVAPMVLPGPRLWVRVGPLQAPPLGKGCASRPAADPCRAGRPWMGPAAAPGAAGVGVLRRLAGLYPPGICCSANSTSLRSWLTFCWKAMRSRPSG